MSASAGKPPEGSAGKPPEPALQGVPARRYRILLALAGAAVVWERLWPRLWPTACVLGAFVGLALLDVLPSLADWLHTGILAVFTAAFVTAIAWAWPAMRRAGHPVARARLERDSGLADRPLQALEDGLAAGRADPLARALWLRHQHRMARRIGTLSVHPPQSDIARHEPWGVRAGVVLLLAIGVASGHGDAGARLLRALDPGRAAGDRASLVELWITPPAYTGGVPMFLSSAPSSPTASGSAAAAPDDPASAGPSPLRVPAGSAVLARASGIGSAPTLMAGEAAVPFTTLAGKASGLQAWSAETTLTVGTRLAVRDGWRTIANWPINVIPDAVPVITFAAPPAPAGNGLLGLAYKAHDDYGVNDVTAVIDDAEVPAADAEPGKAPAAGAAPGDVLRVPLPVPAPSAIEVSGSSIQDLAASPMAGQAVRIHLEATDAKGQVGRSDETTLMLPERTFSHPVARALAGLRKQLFTPSPAIRSAARQELSTIAAVPAAFAGDTTVSLTLAVAAARLHYDESAAAVPQVRDLLWETALRIEQGGVPVAERRLDAARQRLNEALQRNAPSAEIDRLMDELHQALDQYLAAAAAELARRDEKPAPLDPQQSLLHAQDLTDMLESARQLARTGGREAAMRMLAEMQHALDALRSGLRQAPNPDIATAHALMQSLRDLAARQQSLLDETFRRLRASEPSPTNAERNGADAARLGTDRRAPAPNGANGMPSPQKGANKGANSGTGKGDSRDQQALRSDLGALMLNMDEFLGEIPPPLGDADRAMRGAIEALDKRHPTDALNQQSRAADALSRAMDAASEAMAQRIGGMIGVAGPGSDSGGEQDIFGRPPDGRRGLATGTLDIPERSETHRAQQILGELRRRAAERSRPQSELDYIDRLLKQF
ncbi:MAG: TIGR02302 family protein [Rhodospirillales bacterium]|nr:TIGR02302 family protein [Rhodospirillales bacterium]